MNVAVQVFSYREDTLSQTLDAYSRLTVPEWADVTFEAAVTPRPSLRASTVEQAKSHDVFTLFRTGAGKLTSRNEAHDHAVTDLDADVIVAGDADAPPLHDDYLHRLLEPLRGGEAAAANARPVAPVGPVGVATNLLGWADDYVRPHLNGQGHALSRRAWEQAGPFDTDRDQTDSTQVRQEEEFAFRRRVERVGPVADLWSARVRNDTRRTRCRWRQSTRTSRQSHGDYCGRRGVVTFAPRDRQ